MDSSVLEKDFFGEKGDKKYHKKLRSFLQNSHDREESFF